MRRTSLVRQALTKSAAPGPVTEALPRWLTSKTPTRSRTAVCSATTPPPGYSIGMSQPPKSAILAPRATWRSCRGEVSGEVVPDVAVVMGANLPLGGCRLARIIERRYHSSRPPPRHPRDAPGRTRAPASTSTKESLVANLTISNRSAADTPGDALVVALVPGDGGATLAPGHGLPRKTVVAPQVRHRRPRAGRQGRRGDDPRRRAGRRRQARRARRRRRAVQRDGRPRGRPQGHRRRDPLA